jgi:hypothetical protein
MNSDLKEIIETTKDLLGRLDENSDVAYTRFKDIGALKTEISTELEELENGNMDFLLKVYSHYLPTSTFQESYIDEHWENNQLDVSARMDELYQRLRPIKRQESTIEKIKNWFKT